MLTATNLAHSFDYPLFSGVDLKLNPASSTAITGASGSGKSTILHILSTLLKPKSGEVIYRSKSLYKLSLSELLHIRRLDFGIIFQSHYLFKGFSGLENIELAEILSGQKMDKGILDSLNISEVLHQKVGELSGGQQQRVSIARVLAKRPKIIFADEPTGNLDQHTASEVMRAIMQYIRQNEAALIIVTHDENLAQKCDRVLHLSDHKLADSVATS